MGVFKLVGDALGAFGAEKAEDQQYAASQRADALTRETRDMQMAFLREGRDTGRGDIQRGTALQADTLSQIPQRVQPLYESGYANLRNLAGQGARAQSGLYQTGGRQAQREIAQGYTGAQGGIDRGFAGAGQELNQFRDAAGNIISGGRDAAGRELTGGYDTAAGLYSGALERGIEGLDPYSQAGQGAIQGMASQVGGSVYDSPEFQNRVGFAQDAARERLSALGMAESGRDVLEETGIANQMYMEEQARQDAMRSQLAGYGYGAAGTQAGLESQLGSAQAQAALGTGQAQAGLYERGAAQELGVAGDVAGQLASQDINRGLAEADLSTQRAQAMSGLSREQAAQQAAIQSGLYGQLMQQGASQTADQANLQQNYLANLANIYGQEGAALANIATGTAGAQAGVAGTAGSNLAQIAIGQGDAAAASKLAQFGAGREALAGIGDDIRGIIPGMGGGGFQKTRTNSLGMKQLYDMEL